MNKGHLLFGLLAGLVCAGCGKHAERAAPQLAANPAENTAPPAQPAATAGRQQAAPPQGSTAQRQAPAVAAPSSPASNTANSEAALAALTQAVRRYSFEKRRMPSSVQEVIAAGYVSPIPQPPAGKKFVLDTKNVQVVLQ